MSISDVFRIVQSGGPDAILLLLIFVGLLLKGPLALQREVGYRDALLQRQQEALTRQQDLFDQALDLLQDQSRRQAPRHRTT